MTVLEAIEAVLAGEGAPLHYREITKRVLAKGLWKTAGKTPEATVNARLVVEINQHGKNSRFQRTDKGIFALRSLGLPEFVLKPKEKKATPAHSDEALSFTDAAEKVLERFGNKQPMHYRAITQKALELKWVHTAGQTPEATLYAQVLTEIARKTRRGETPRFVKHGKGFVGLTKWQARGVVFQIEQNNNTVRQKLLAKLHDMPPVEFEALISRLLTAMGFEHVVLTPHHGDRGIDVRGVLVVADVIRTRMAVQVKCWRPNVQSPIIQQVRGSLGTHEQGLIITTSDFSPGAREEAIRPNAVPVALMNGKQLVALLVEYQIGVRRTPHDLIELGEAADE